MRYGEMTIFPIVMRRFDRGRCNLSMANPIEPGTFDLDSMGESDCPGVKFFNGMPGPKNSMKAFDFILETARPYSVLGGELRGRTSKRAEMMIKPSLIVRQPNT